MSIRRNINQRAKITAWSLITIQWSMANLMRLTEIKVVVPESGDDSRIQLL
jgi:hypothetical protein